MTDPNYVQLSGLADAIPDTDSLLSEVLLLQLQATRAAALVLDIEITNINSIKLLSEQCSKLVSLVNAVEQLRTPVALAVDSAVFKNTFAYEPTNYQAVDPSAVEALTGGANE